MGIAAACMLSAALTLPALGEEGIQDAGENIIEIKRVSSSSTPIMKNDSLIYYLDLIFKDFPGKFWSYSDTFHHTAIIEIFGNKVRAPVISLPGSCPITKMQIKNNVTKMALSGQNARISFDVDPGWNVDIEQPDSSNIHLTIWKKMEVREITEAVGKKKR